MGMFQQTIGKRSKTRFSKWTQRCIINQTSPRACLHHKLHGPKDGHSKGLDGTGVPVEKASYRLINWECDQPDDPTILFQVVALSPLIPLRHLGRGASSGDSRESSSGHGHLGVISDPILKYPTPSMPLWKSTTLIEKDLLLLVQELYRPRIYGLLRNCIHLPQFDRLIVCGEKEMSRVLPLEPPLLW